MPLERLRSPFGAASVFAGLLARSRSSAQAHRERCDWRRRGAGELRRPAWIGERVAADCGLFENVAWAYGPIERLGIDLIGLARADSEPLDAVGAVKYGRPGIAAGPSGYRRGGDRTGRSIHGDNLRRENSGCARGFAGERERDSPAGRGR